MAQKTTGQATSAVSSVSFTAATHTKDNSFITNATSQHSNNSSSDGSYRARFSQTEEFDAGAHPLELSSGTICLLCKRELKTLENLKKHQQSSELHKVTILSNDFIFLASEAGGKLTIFLLCCVVLCCVFFFFFFHRSKTWRSPRPSGSRNTSTRSLRQRKRDKNAKKSARWLQPPLRL